MKNNTKKVLTKILKAIYPLFIFILIGTFLILALETFKLKPREIYPNAKSENQLTSIYQINTIVNELKDYHKRYGEYPKNSIGLNALSLTDGQKIDPWGNKYDYEAVKKTYEVVSYGKDGIPGGIDDDMDIASYNIDYFTK